jgi:hypothetical protein
MNSKLLPTHPTHPPTLPPPLPHYRLTLTTSHRTQLTRANMTLDVAPSFQWFHHGWTITYRNLTSPMAKVAFTNSRSLLQPMASPREGIALSFHPEKPFSLSIGNETFPLFLQNSLPDSVARYLLLPLPARVPTRSRDLFGRYPHLLLPGSPFSLSPFFFFWDTSRHQILLSLTLLLSRSLSHLSLILPKILHSSFFHRMCSPANTCNCIDITCHTNNYIQHPSGRNHRITLN